MIKEQFISWKNINEFNAIGIYEVLIKIGRFINILKDIEQKIRLFDPKIVISIDSPSFNYRLLRRIQDLKKSKTYFYHYVAPTVWAWKSYRSKLYAKLYHKLFVLFDFEIKYFKVHGLKTIHVGHQIFYNKKKIKKVKKKIITFLPGSRESEIKNNINEFSILITNTISQYKNFTFYILTFKDHLSLFAEIKKKFKNNLKIVTNFEDKQKILSESYLAITASGSVTLELAKYLTPMIVVYKTHLLTKLIVKLLVRLKYASIINIYFDREIVPEFLFDKFNFKNVFPTMKKLIEDKSEREKQINMLKKFSKKMLIKEKNPSKIIVDTIL